VQPGVGRAEEARALLQELFRSETVYPQGKGELQLTVTPEFIGGDRDSARTSAVLEYGISSAWQVGFGLDTTVTKRTAPLGTDSQGDELELGIKRSFMNVRDSSTSLALGFETTRPAAANSEDGVEKHAEYGPFVVIAKDLRRWNAQIFAQAGLNLRSLREQGVEMEELEEEEDDRTEWAVGGFFQAGPVVLTHELNWISPRWGQLSDRRQVYWTPGVVWHMGSENGWELGLGASLGLTRSSDPLRVALKLTGEFERVPFFGRE
jgi:hypothetical protein